MNNVFEIILQLFKPQETDGAILLWAKELLLAALILALFWLFSQAISSLLVKWGKKITAFTNTDLDDRILDRSIPHVSRLLNVLGLYLAVYSLSLHEKVTQVFSGFLYVVLVAIIFNLLYHAFDELLQWYISGRQDDSSVLISRHMAPVAEKLAMLFLMSTALIIIFKHFNYDIFSLVTALGIGSLAIGMAAKDTLAHMISGFTLMLDRPFQIGDRIRLANGQVGDVTDIGLRSTKILGTDSTMLIIPNSDLCNSTVVNLVRPTNVTQGRINLGVGYESNIDRVKELLVGIARADAEVLGEPAPLAQFTSFGDSALNLMLLFWISNPGNVGSVTDRLNCEILRRFREDKIEIPFPIRTVKLEQHDVFLPMNHAEQENQ